MIRGRKHLATLYALIAGMAFVTVLVGLVCILALYRTAYHDQIQELESNAKCLAGLIESVAEFDAEFSNEDDPGGAFGATMRQVEKGIGKQVFARKSEEIVIGYVSGESIITRRVSNQRKGLETMAPVSNDGSLAVPMYRALKGEQGHLETVDYAGTRVMAGFSPVPSLQIGIVHKISVAEMQSPYRQAAVIAGLIGLGAILLCALLFIRLVAPLQLRTEQDYRFLRSVVDSTPDWIFAKDDSHRYILVNQAFANSKGLEPAAMVGRPDTDFYPPELCEGDPARGRRGFHDDDHSALSGRAVHYPRDTIALSNGQQLTMDSSKFPLVDELGTVYGVLGILRDVTHVVGFEAELQRERDFAQSLVETAPVIVLLLDPTGHVKHCNSYFTDLTGYALEEVQGKEWFSTFLPERDRPRISTCFLQVLEQGRLSGVVNPIVTRDGSEREIEWSNKVMLDQSGETSGVLSIGVDVTDRVVAARSADETRKRLELIFNSTHDFLALVELRCDGSHQATAVNDAFVNVIARLRPGATREWLLGQTIDDCLKAMFGWGELELSFNHELYERVRSGGEAIFTTMPLETEYARVVMEADLIPVAGPGGEITQVLWSGRDVTERYLREEELRIREVALASSLNAIAMAAPDGQITYANQAFCDLWGLTEVAEAIGRQPREFLPEADQIISEMLRDGSWTGKVKGQRQDGTWLDVQISAHLVRDRVGMPICMMGSFLDVTERTNAEHRAKESLSRLNEAQRIAKVGSWELDLSSNELIWSDEVFNLFELDPQRFGASYEAFLDAIHPDDRKMVNDAYSNSLVDKQPYEVTHRLLMRDGSIKHVREQCVTYYDDQGKALRSVGTIQDISQEVQAELAIRESEARLREAQQIALLGSWEFYHRTGHLIWSDETFRMFGQDKNNFKPSYDAFMEIIFPEDRESVGRAFGEAVANRTPFNEVFRLALSDGQVKIVRGRAQTEYAEDGRPIRTSGTNQDITEQVLTQRELSQTQLQVSAIVDNSPVVLFALDLEGRITLAQGKGLGIIGTTAEALLGKSIFDLYPEQPGLRSYIKQVFNGEEVNFIFQGDGWYFDTHYAPMRNESGEIAGLLGAAYDVSSQVKASERIEAQLQEKELLLKEIHHRVKNNLQVISSMIYLQASASADPQFRELLKDSQNRIASMALIHETLYQTADFQRIDFAEYAANLCNYLFQSFGVERSRVGLVIDGGAVLLPLNSAISCGLIINEAVSNSLKYGFPEEATGTVEVRLMLEGDSEFALCVSDDGVGFQEDAGSTRVGALGVKLIERLSSQLGGRLSREPGKGVRYKVIFPRAGTS